MWDYATATTKKPMWAVIGGWDLFMSLTSFLWFHEQINGPMWEDNLYADFNRVAGFVYIVQALMTGVAYYLDTALAGQVSLATSSVTIFFGTILWAVINGNQKDREEQQQAYLDAINAKEARERGDVPNEDNNQNEA